MYTKGNIFYTIIILIGHPELKTELSKNIYDSVHQRIIVNYKMKGLSREEVKQYITTRLKIANVNNNFFKRVHSIHYILAVNYLLEGLIH